MVVKKLASPTLNKVIRFISQSTALQSKFKNNIKFDTINGSFKTKNVSNNRSQKVALATGSISIIGIIGILLMLMLGLGQ